MNTIEEIPQSYRVTRQMVNCRLSSIVFDVKQCKIAAKQLNRKYVGRTTSEYRPAGCYWNGNKGTYFNTITDPSSTKPTHFGNRGGVCTKPGANNSILLIDVTN